MTNEVEPLSLRITEAHLLTPLIRQLTLSPIHKGTRLPGFTAGAHIAVEVATPSGLDWRRYSLVNTSHVTGATDTPGQYVIAVRLEESGLGGSHFIHESVKEGDTIRVLLPRNEFELAPPEQEVVLLGGGIGITPILSMAAHCRSVGRQARLVYVGRQRSHMAYLAELQTLLEENLTIHCDDEQGGPIDLTALLKNCGPNAVLHVCGPQALLDGVLACGKALGWPDSRIRFELFSAPSPQEGDTDFEVVLSSSRRVLTVPANKTILQMLEEAGCDPMYDCQRGECGVCICSVLEGEIDHRDYVLTEREKAANNVIVTCVSRAKSSRLVLDL